jgi:hypothetical protein
MITVAGLLWVLLTVFAMAIVAKWVFVPTERALPERTHRAEAELARLREEMDRLTTQVDRLSEEQSFMVRLLSEGDRARLAERPRLTGGDSAPPPDPEAPQG